ncbi:SusD/RagB family nutrient-binding outer membrane lipoprotein [Pontibacter sp. E15-1]|uniref:SusD/RagB family nutrient-binding outer membrane lipoprotein n=1 Tax=Pontibacter sp. E15-1 TaxID=2919918 RepID=UPI001F4F6470|nr:SusD/RagB family nutrient-binding outer membrane lipoprotein [Pontibacter sp. E15-1]MCJ8167150.1 SusD/RagB family nutrient-binding outer membrane lipoprotein [Pontibacter sp. E15-1]
MMNIKKTFVLFLALSCAGVSCTDDFEKINLDPNRIEKISPGTLLNPIIYEMASFNTSRSAAFTFEIMQVSLPFPSPSGGEHRYDIGDNAGSSTWSTYYRWLTNIREMRAAAVEAQDPNYEAIALTLNAWVYSLLTDSFGDVPMVEAGRGDEGIFYPAFDTQQEIYMTILSDLETANGLFDTSRDMIYGTDILYGNKVENWQRFCNSLRLRLLLRVSKREEMDSFNKMAQIINNPAEYPVFTKNEEAAILQVSGVPPLVSPWGRAVDFRTGRAAAAFFLDNLNDLSDPRRERFVGEARMTDGVTSIGYKGIPSGYAGNDAQFDFIPSDLNIELVTAPMIAVIMGYAEVEFIKAELAQKSILSADAQTHYENGVKAAIRQWGIEVPADYFENPAAAYDGTLERIMLQKYYALYFTDYQQWFEYRRTGLPVLPKTEAMLNDKMVPVRFKYPSSVQVSNSANYRKAVEAMGGDAINTKVWWEK